MEKPHNIQIELVRGCNRHCSFCAIGVVPKKFEIMSMETLAAIAEKVSCFDPIRIEFAMRGEPFIAGDRVIGESVSILRALCKGSSISLSTNGDILFKGNYQKSITSFFSSGGNILIVNNYDAGLREKRLLLLNEGTAVPVLKFPESGFSPWTRCKPNTRVIVLMECIEDNQSKLTRKLTNQGGNVGKVLDKPLNKKCVHPFRELVFFVDGSIPMCCRDWKEECLLGNINNFETIHDAWENTKFRELREALIKGDRTRNVVCKKCNYFGGMRQGLVSL
jgi:radical SAM protein with 4Fe4S-binding SPASM domain